MYVLNKGDSRLRFAVDPIALCTPTLQSRWWIALTGKRFRFEDLFEGETAEGVVEDLREGRWDEFVDQASCHNETWLPSAVDYLVENVLEKLLAGQKIREMETHVSDGLHVHLSTHLLPRQLGHGGRLYQIICKRGGVCYFIYMAVSKSYWSLYDNNHYGTIQRLMPQLKRTYRANTNPLEVLTQSHCEFSFTVDTGAEESALKLIVTR